MDIFMGQNRIEETPSWNEEILSPAWEELKDSVLKDLSENFLHQDTKGRQALAIAETMSDAWWKKREAQEGYQVIQELYRYADERAARAAREAKKAELAPTRRISRFSGTHHKKDVRRGEESMPPVVLSVQADEAEMAVLKQTQKYFFHPETRPPKLFKETPLKLQSELSQKSIEDYTRLKKQVKKELRTQGFSTGWDLALYLIRAARECSVSTYKKKRAVVTRLMEEASPAAVGLIRSLPSYAELCSLLGREPSRRSTAVTEARRAKQNEKVFNRLLTKTKLSPEHADAIRCLRYTGARCSEARSLRLEQVADGIRITLQTAKTGARKKNLGPSTRSWVESLDSEAGQVLAGVLARRGEAPAPYSGHALRSAWHRARVELKLNQNSHWDLHSLRHQYARELKAARVAELRELHGEDWRRKLYGRDWRNSPRYVEEFYRPIADRLGHSCAAMAKIYG